MLKVIILVALFGYGSASLVGGRRTYINYNSECGTWNDPRARAGKILDECCPVDATFPGSPWQQLSVSFYSPSFQQFSGNTAGGCSSYSVISEKVLDDGTGTVGIEHVMRMGALEVTKTEQWNFDGQIVLITFKVKYPKSSFGRICRPITNLTVMHAVDPDQDREPFFTFQTLNDVVYNGGDGLFAEAVGPQSCKTMGYGICATRLQDGSQDEVGFGQWQRPTSTNLEDPSGELRDDTMHYKHTEARPLHCGDEREFRFFAVWGKCHTDARNNFLRAHADFCQPCYRLPRLSHPRPPRCAGRCPCTGRGRSNCSCNYRCPTRGVISIRDIRTAEAESASLKVKCAPRTTLLRAAPVAVANDNVEGTAPTASDCSTISSEGALLAKTKAALVREVISEELPVRG